MVQDEENSVPMTFKETLERLRLFCDKWGLMKILEGGLKVTKRQMIDTLCQNVDSSFLNYKVSGNLDRTL